MKTDLYRLEWDEKYSVGVSEIDSQHKKMFEVINQLINVIDEGVSSEKLVSMLNSLTDYKRYHFATEEKYFEEFGYEGAEEHIAAHRLFGQRLDEIQEKYKDDAMLMAYEMVDFLEDWLLEHLIKVDQKYVECFRTHGLK